MSKEVITVNIGSAFLPLLAILFIGLKLTNVIAWSWWWVLAPVWAPLAIFIVLFLLIFGVLGILQFLKVL